MPKEFLDSDAALSFCQEKGVSGLKTSDKDEVVFDAKAGTDLRDIKAALVTLGLEAEDLKIDGARGIVVSGREALCRLTKTYEIDGLEEYREKGWQYRAGRTQTRER